MSDAVLVATVSGVFTLLGSFLGVMASSKLTQYRLQKLEDKVNKHNSIIERTYKLEGRMDNVEKNIAKGI